MHHLSYLTKFFLKYRRMFAWGIVFVVISNLFAVLPPRLVRYSINLIEESVRQNRAFSGSTLMDDLHGQLAYYLSVFALLTLGLALVRGLFMYFMRQTIIVMSRWIEFDLKNELYAKYQELDRTFYQQHNTGDLMSRLSEDVGRVRMYVGPAYMYGINMLVLVVLTLAAMAQVNWRMTLFTVMPLPFLAIGVFYVNNLVFQRSERIQQRLSALTTFAQEAFSGIRVLKSYGRERAFKGLFDAEVETLRTDTLALAKVDAVFQPLTLMLIGLSTLIAVSVGSWQVLAGNISAGNVAEFVIYINMLTWPITSVGWVAGMVQRASASQKRINEFLESQPDVRTDVGQAIALQGRVQMKDVSFSYAADARAALKNIDFTLLPGETLGIVGRTGSGKTTLINLLMRVYDVDQGTIAFDDQNLKDLHLGELRNQIGYVPQDVFLFSDTIANNIAFGMHDATPQQIADAAQAADVLKDIERFPEGFDTILGERGVTLSGGQKQRVAIARALIRKPTLFLFDDCLAAVDTETERAILSRLREKTKEITTIIVSHRVSSVLHANQVIVMEQGQIAEYGTPADLLARNGIFAHTYARQQHETEVQKAGLNIA